MWKYLHQSPYEHLFRFKILVFEKRSELILIRFDFSVSRSKLDPNEHRVFQLFLVEFLTFLLQNNQLGI